MSRNAKAAHEKAQQKLKYIILGTLIICVFSILNFAIDIGTPFPGFLSHYNMSKSAFMLHQSTPHWWRTGELSNLTGKDKIISVNGQTLSLEVHESTLYQKAFDEGKKD